MAVYTNIDNPGLFFNTVLYTGNGTAIGSGGNAITGVGFQPDWVWIKNRSGTTAHHLQDVVRGPTKAVYSNLTNAEGTSTENVNSFDSDGFTVGSGTGVNTNANNFASWNWLAANGTASNSDGSITSTVSANQTAGFSIVKYTGTGSNATVGHGLGVAPSMILFKNLDTARTWIVYHKSLGATKNLYLDLTNAENTGSDLFNDTEPTSTVFSIGTSVGVNESGDDIIAYCFAEKQGYSKIASYTGNGNADGTFVYTGFKPAWLMYKITSGGDNWQMLDNKRNSFNTMNSNLFANLNNAEITSSNYNIDFLSNGFKVRNSHSSINGSGSTYIYMAFAESPFVNSNGVPTNAR